MVYKTTQRVSVFNLELFGPVTTKLLDKKVGEFSVVLYREMGWWVFFTHQHGYRNINVWRFSNFEQP